MKISQAMLLAAGLGTRLKPFTELEPKALLPVMGIPIAQYLVDHMVREGIHKIVANIHHLAPRARLGLSALDFHGAQFLISDESQILLGSGGGIRKALPYFQNQPFFIINTDILFDFSLQELASYHIHLRNRFGVKLTLAVCETFHSHGPYREIFFDLKKGLITGLGKVLKRHPFYTGVAVIEPEALEQLPCDVPLALIPSVLEPAIGRQQAGVFLTSGHWVDIGTPLLWQEAHLDIIEQLEKNSLPKGWKSCIEKTNKRIGEALWISRASPPISKTASWTGPSYWSCNGDRVAQSPKKFGPRSILYGALQKKEVLQNGIGFRGIWQKRTK